MSDHTKEPWEAITDCPGKCCWHIQQVGNDSVMDRINVPEMSEGDARRIVACVNACAGLPQAALDGGWTAAGLSAYAKNIEHQRNELLTVLKQLRAMEIVEQLDIIDAAIDKVEAA